MRLKYTLLTIFVTAFSLYSLKAQFPCNLGGNIVSAAGFGSSVDLCDSPGGSIVNFNNNVEAIPFGFVVTDENGIIVSIGLGSSIDFSNFSGNSFNVYSFTFIGGLIASPGQPLSGTPLANGCFSLSNNFVTINLSGGLEAAVLEGGPFSFCVGDGVADTIPAGAINVTGNPDGSDFSWIVTDTALNILGIPNMPSDVDFDGAGTGECLIWYLSYDDAPAGLEVDANVGDLVGCYGLSNSISVFRNDPDGGTLDGGPFTFCVGDGVADTIPAGAITLTGNMGTNSAWVVTDADGNILGLPAMPSMVNFDGAGTGECLVWHLSFEDGLVGAEVGLNANDLEGCFDLSNPISVFRNQPDGGVLDGGPFTFCVGDGVADTIPAGAITLTGNMGTNSAWVITDADGNILGLPAMPSMVNFDGAGTGECLVWHLSFEDGLVGAEVGLNANDLEGCFDLSNPISVFRNQPDGGVLDGGPFTFCVGDGVADTIPAGAITLTGNTGTNSAWVVTDADGNILGLPAMPSMVDFDGAGLGECLVWHLSFEDGLVGAEVGLNANDLEGCFDLSNPISVFRTQPDGGTLDGGPFTFFCVGDGVADTIPAGAITLTGNTGTNSAWVVTDADGNILGLPAMPSMVNFDGAGLGECLVWHLSFEDGLVGAEVGLNANDLEGCFDLSNPISVFRNGQPDGGTLDGGPFTFCVGDGVADTIPAGAITLTGNTGTNSAWVVTDADGNILGLPAMPSMVNFDGAGLGECLVWHLSFEDGLVGAEVGLNANDLEGCFDLSNPISVFRNQPDGGVLDGGPFTFCVGDGVADTIPAGAITLTGNTGTNSAWVVTDADGNILGLPAMPSMVNFDGAGLGECLVWHLSFEDGLVGAEVGLNANDLEGCFDLSNPISVFRNQPDGGTLTGGPFSFCVGDGDPDMIPSGALTLSGATGTNSAWVVTDTDGNILGLPSTPIEVDFDGAGIGECLVWHLSFEDGLVGAEVGLNANDLEGCFDLSNPISVFRNEQPEGGTLDGGPFSFCVGDGIADTIPAGAITLTGNSGTNSAWVVTDLDGNILGLPAMPSMVNFDQAGGGECLVWHLSFEDGLMGAEVGLNANDLVGCFDLSNPINVFREEVNGGMVMTEDGETVVYTCAGDSIADIIRFDSTGTAPDANFAYVVTDENTVILGLPGSMDMVDFEAAGIGTCLVWGLSYTGNLTAALGDTAAITQLSDGCFDLSDNVITVYRDIPEGGMVMTEDSLTEVKVCIDDGIADIIKFDSTGTSNSQYTYVITDNDNVILAVPGMDMADFDGAGAGICRVWGLAYTGNITAMVGDTASAVQLTDECFDLSDNFIIVNRIETNGGEVATVDGETEIYTCPGDGMNDVVQFESMGAIGSEFTYVITDENTVIIAVPDGDMANFEGAGTGTCLVWGLSYTGNLTAEIGDTAAITALSDGCFDLSDNVITVYREQPDGGMVMTEAGETEITLMVNDSTENIVAFDSVGVSNSQFTYVVTDENNVILAVPGGDVVDFGLAGPGVCRVWGLAYTGNIIAMAGDTASAVSLTDDCFDLSDNFVNVIRVQGFGNPVENFANAQAARFEVSLAAWPNPTSRDLTLNVIQPEADASVTEVAMLRIVDANGQVVSSRRIDATIQEQQIDMAVANLPAGLYTIVYQSGSTLTSTRFLKQ
jgi:hypothetical protein